MGQALRKLYSIIAGRQDSTLNVPKGKLSEELSDAVKEKYQSASENQIQQSTILSPLRPNKRSIPFWPTEIAPPDNLNLAIENIRASGFGEITEREKAALRILLHDYFWKASSPHCKKDGRFLKIQSRFTKSLPNIVPVLDSYD